MVLHIKKVYRRLGNENADTRARRIRAEQSLINAYRKAEHEAAKADPELLSAFQVDMAALNLAEDGAAAIKLLAGRVERECDRILAAGKKEELAEEMVRIKLATWKEEE